MVARPSAPLPFARAVVNGPPWNAPDNAVDGAQSDV
jgi:hypothetical protein